MAEVQRRKLTGKLIGVLILAAIVIAVVSTLLQKIFLGHSIPAVTGGVVGAVIVMTLVSLRKKPE